MTKKPLPDTAFKRMAIGSKTAVKVAGKHALHKAKHVLKKPDKAKEDAHYQAIAKDIFKALSMLRGTALKAAQLISVELEFLPESFRNELKKACYQVPPLNKAIVRKVVKNETGQYPETLFKSFEGEAFAAASIGQVHRAATHDGKKVAVKLQYPGIDKTIDNDMNILKTLLLKSPIPELKKKSKLLTTFLNECAERFTEESNYEHEAKNIHTFKKTNPFPYVHFPVPLEDLTSKHMLTMTFLEGDHIDEWLAKNPSQTEKNLAGQRLWNNFTHYFLNHGLLHADPNPGNYLFMADCNIGMLDFGCVKACDKNFPTQLATIIDLYQKDDIEPILAIYREWGIISEASAADTKGLTEHLKYFKEWITLPHRTKTFDFKQHPHYMRNRFALGNKEAMNILQDTTHNFVMFDRAYMGILNILQKLEAEVEISFKRASI